MIKIVSIYLVSVETLLISRMVCVLEVQTCAV